MTKTKHLLAGTFAAALIGLTGCGSSDSGAPASAPSPSSRTAPNVGVSDQRPSGSARLTCGAEIHEAIEKIVAPQRVPLGAATWVDGLYTCTYQLPTGALVLSVKDSANPASAMRYFASLRDQVGPHQTIRGLAALGLPAYETTSGTVVFLKDSSTLMVDATHVTREAASSYTSRSDLAYEVASDVIGCWTEM
jgi:hypothetical protein